MNNIINGNCLEVMQYMDENAIDSIVTDPPYGLKFMGKDWDHGIPGSHFWEYALRVAKPGAHLLAFGGTRTHHRLMVAIEDAGWEIRDCLMWVYGSGFPKSHNLKGDYEGWGTTLKPAWEPVIMARKPFKGTIASTVQTWGAGAINIDGCRVETDELKGKVYNNKGNNLSFGGYGKGTVLGNSIGRWPANLIHDGSEDVVSGFPETKKGHASGYNFEESNNDNPTHIIKNIKSGVHFGDSGSASRFFYCAKASPSERGEFNKHPTVKPLSLMQYLCKLVTPPGGILLDPFCGSGSTLIAARNEGFNYIGIELNKEYCNIAEKRLSNTTN